MACLALISKSPSLALRGLSVLAASLSVARKYSPPLLSTLTPWTLLSSTFWPCKSPDTWMNINLHKPSTHFRSRYHLSLLFWFVTVPCRFWPCKASLHHPSQTSSACCLSPFPPCTQHHGSFYPTAIQTAWLLTEHSMNGFFDYSHTHTYSFFFTQTFGIVLTQPSL